MQGNVPLNFIKNINMIMPYKFLDLGNKWLYGFRVWFSSTLRLTDVSDATRYEIGDAFVREVTYYCSVQYGLGRHYLCAVNEGA